MHCSAKDTRPLRSAKRWPDRNSLSAHAVVTEPVDFHERRPMQSINPHSEQVIRTYEPQDAAEVDRLLRAAENAFQDWRKSSFADRAQLMKSAGGLLRERKQQLAELMADEMGKVLRDGIAEIEKCAGCCDYYAEHAQRFLANVS